MNTNVHTTTPATGLAQRQAALWRRRLAVEGRVALKRSRGPSLNQRVLAAAVRGTLRAAGLYERGLANADAPLLVQRTMCVTGLPEALEGFRILHLGDFHFDGRQSFAERIRDLIDPSAADLCVLTGDSIFRFDQPFETVEAGIRIVMEGVHARHGTYACMGNNDYAAFVEPFAQAGVQWLINEHAVIEHQGSSMCLAGVDDPQRFQCADLGLALEGAPPECFTVLLAHSPALARRAAERGVHVYLTGHTHGGQLCLPWLGAVFRNGLFPRDRVHGLWQVHAMAGHTTSGLGCTAVPVRFNCPPEAVLLTLTGSIEHGASGHPA